MRRRLLPLLLILLCGHALAADNSAIPEAASALNTTQSATAPHFMAVTANRHATAAAVAMLERGGSAIDAAIAAQLVLGLTGAAIVGHRRRRVRAVLGKIKTETALFRRSRKLRPPPSMKIIFCRRTASRCPLPMR